MVTQFVRLLGLGWQCATVRLEVVAPVGAAKEGDFGGKIWVDGRLVAAKSLMPITEHKKVIVKLGSWQDCNGNINEVILLYFLGWSYCTLPCRTIIPCYAVPCFTLPYRVACIHVQGWQIC